MYNNNVQIKSMLVLHTLNLSIKVHKKLYGAKISDFWFIIIILLGHHRKTDKHGFTDLFPPSFVVLSNLFFLSVETPPLSETRKKPHCGYCKNHGKHSTMRQHTCLYKDHCKCVLCILTGKLAHYNRSSWSLNDFNAGKAQLIMRHQQRVWRFQNQKNENNDSTRYYILCP